MIVPPQRTVQRVLLIGGTAAALNFGLGWLAAALLPDPYEAGWGFHLRYWIPVLVRWLLAMAVCGTVIAMSGQGLPSRSRATIAGLILTVPVPVGAVPFYVDRLLSDVPSFLMLTFDIFFAERVFFAVAAGVLVLAVLFVSFLWQERGEILPLAPVVFGMPALVIFLPNGLAAYLPTVGVFVIDAAVWIAHYALLVSLLVWPSLLLVRRSRGYREPPP